MSSIRFASLLLFLISSVYTQSQDPSRFCGVVEGGYPRAIGNYCDSSRTGYFECSGSSPRFVQCPASTHCGCFSLNCKDVPTIGDYAPCVREVNVPAIPSDFTAVTLNNQPGSSAPFVKFLYGSASASKWYINPNTANETSYLVINAPGQGYSGYAQTFNYAGNRVCIPAGNPTGSVASVVRDQFDFGARFGSKYEYFGRNTTSGFDTYYYIDPSQVVYKYSVSLTNPSVPVSASRTYSNGLTSTIEVQNFNLMTAPASNFVPPAVCNDI